MGRRVASIAITVLATLSGTPIYGQTAPTFLQTGPYGNPLLLAPAPRSYGVSAVSPAGLLLFGGVDRGRSFPAPTKIFSLRSAASPQANGSDEDDDDDEEDPRPTRPGTLPKSFAKVPDPTPFLRNRSIGPHLLPDAEYSLTDRTTLGLIGQWDRLAGRVNQGVVIPSGSRAVSATGYRSSGVSSARSKDVGLGLSLEYKFGH